MQDTPAVQTWNPHLRIQLETWNIICSSSGTPIHQRSYDQATLRLLSNFITLSRISFSQLYKVPITSFDQLRIVHLDDPDTTSRHLGSTLQLYQKYITAICARLEEDQVLIMSDQSFEVLLSIYSRTRDGYTFLKAFLAATLMTDAKNISQLSTPPPADSRAHPYKFASNLVEFFQ